jgi:hypothetical protein
VLSNQTIELEKERHDVLCKAYDKQLAKMQEDVDSILEEDRAQMVKNNEESKNKIQAIQDQLDRDSKDMSDLQRTIYNTCTYYVCVCVYVCVYIYIHIYVCVYICMYIYMYIVHVYNVCVCVYVCVCGKAPHCRGWGCGRPGLRARPQPHLRTPCAWGLTRRGHHISVTTPSSASCAPASITSLRERACGHSVDHWCQGTTLRVMEKAMIPSVVVNLVLAWV